MIDLGDDIIFRFDEFEGSGRGVIGVYMEELVAGGSGYGKNDGSIGWGNARELAEAKKRCKSGKTAFKLGTCCGWCGVGVQGGPMAVPEKCTGVVAELPTVAVSLV